MPVDTREKRASVLNLLTPLPLADGVIGEGDRGQVSWVYAGLVVVAERRDLTITVTPVRAGRAIGVAPNRTVTAARPRAITASSPP